MRAAVQDVKVKFIAAGSASSHCILGDMEGRCYTWGRNEVRTGALRRHCEAAVCLV